MVEVDVAAPAMADVAALVGAKTIAPAKVKAPAPVEAGATAPEMVSFAEPEATAETPMHPQDVDLGIPLQEVTSAYVRIHASHF